jgi:ferredoxin
LSPDEIDIQGKFEPIPGFKMPVTYRPSIDKTEIREQIGKLYPQGMMEIRTGIKPVQDAGKCMLCGDCETNCPAEAIVLEPDFIISDQCIACYCCVELCPEGALEVPDVEAYRYY